MLLPNVYRAQVPPTPGFLPFPSLDWVILTILKSGDVLNCEPLSCQLDTERGVYLLSENINTVKKEV